MRKFVEEDEKVYVEWLEKAANQNNPWAMDWLGNWFRWYAGDKEKAVPYFQAGAELGSKYSAGCFADMLRNGEGCEKDLRQAAIWSAKAESTYFWDLLGRVRGALDSDETEFSGCDLNRLCYALGWGSYWYVQTIEGSIPAQDVVFADSCLDYYCSCVEMQQKSIFTFLLCWKKLGLLKDVGRMIAKTVWEDREDNLLKTFEQNDGEEPETKRIKK
jgi:hypothetical protein